MVLTRSMSAGNARVHSASGELTESVHSLHADSHLRLGMTVDAIQAFMQRIGWHAIDGPINYHRDVIELDWLEDVCDDDELSGYDFAYCVRQWLIEEGKAERSVCEVLLAEGAEGVGIATAFYSHMQSVSMCGLDGTVWSMANAVQQFKAELDEAPLFWLDYVSLRQATMDFELPKIRAVISHLDCTVVESFAYSDGEMPYLGRSFCLFETFCTLQACKPLLVASEEGVSELTEHLKAFPVDSEAASAHFSRDKHLIDEFIRRTVGFERVNAMITDALLEGARRRAAWLPGTSTMEEHMGGRAAVNSELARGTSNMGRRDSGTGT